MMKFYFYNTVYQLNVKYNLVGRIKSIFLMTQLI